MDQLNIKQEQPSESEDDWIPFGITVKTEPVDYDEDCGENTDAYTDSSDDSMDETGDRNSKNRTLQTYMENNNAIPRNSFVVYNDNPENVYEDESDDGLYSSDENNVVYEESTDPFDSDEAPDVLDKDESNINTKVQNKGSVSGDQIETSEKGKDNNQPEMLNSGMFDNKIDVKIEHTDHETVKIDEKVKCLNLNEDLVETGECHAEADLLFLMKRNRFLSPYQKNKGKDPISNSNNSNDSDRIISKGQGPYKCKTCGFRFKSRARLKVHSLSHSKESPQSNAENDSLISEQKLDQSCNSSPAGQISEKCRENEVEFEASKEKEKCSVDSYGTSCVPLPQTESIDHLNSETGTSFVDFSNMNSEKPTDKDYDGKNQMSECDMDNKSEILKFKCHFCGMRFKWKNSLRRHCRTKHAGNMFKCLKCSKKFHFESGFLSHLKTCSLESNPNDVFKCSVCEREFMQKKQFRLHLKSHNVAPFKCDICNKHFFAEHNYQRHQQLHKFKETKPETREICNIKAVKEAVPNSTDTDIQNTDKENINSFKCYICDKEFTSKRTLERHASVEHIDNESYKCQACDELFVTEGDLKQHKCQLHFFRCEKCTKIFKTQSALDKHVRIRHPADAPYPCSFCGKGFFAEYNLSQHMQEHQVDHENIISVISNKGISSKTCDKDSMLKKSKTAATNTKTSKTIKANKLNKNEKQARCNLCEIEFVSSKTKRFHFRYQHPDKCTFKCQSCNKGFFHETYFKIHTEKHIMESKGQGKTEDVKQVVADVEIGDVHSETDNTPRHLKCPVKSEVVTSVDNVISPNVVFEAEKVTYSCTRCSKIFKTSSKLEKNFRIKHELIKPHACSVCSKKFSSVAKLEKHSEKHQDGQVKQETFKCEKCEINFSSENSLKEHSLNHCNGQLNFQLSGKDSNISEGDLTKQRDIVNSACFQLEEKDDKSSCDMKTRINKSDHHKESLPGKTGLPLDTQKMEEEYRCKVCDKSYNRRKTMREHFTRMHVESTPFQCKTCVKGFLSKLNYLKHMKVHEKTKSPDQENINSDKSNEVVEQNTTCDSNTISYIDRPPLDSGEGVKEMKKREELHKGDVVSARYLKERRKKIADMQKRYQCKICLRKFFSRFMFKKHIERHDVSRQHIKRFQSSVREIKSKQSQSNEIGNTVRDDSKENEEIVEKEMESKAEESACIEDDVEIFDKEDTKKSEDWCQENVYKDTNKQEKDVKTKSTDKLMEEEKLKKNDSVGSKQEQEQNVTIDNMGEMVTDESKLKCYICPRSFVNAVSQRNHLKTHISKKAPFTCSLCGYGFFDEVHFEQHVYNHESFEPKQIEIEQHTYDKSESVSRNVSCSDNDKDEQAPNAKYRCESCSKEFWLEQTLKQHVCVKPLETIRVTKSVSNVNGQIDQTDDNRVVVFDRVDHRFGNVEADTVDSQCQDGSHLPEYSKMDIKITVNQTSKHSSKSGKHNNSTDDDDQSLLNISDQSKSAICGHSNHAARKVDKPDTIPDDNKKCNASCRESKSLAKEQISDKKKRNRVDDTKLTEMSENENKEKSSQELRQNIFSLFHKVESDKQEKSSQELGQNIFSLFDKVEGDNQEKSSQDLRQKTFSLFDKVESDNQEKSNQELRQNMFSIFDKVESDKQEKSSQELRQNIFSVFDKELTASPSSIENNQEATFACSVCDIKFIYKQNLDNHMLMHEEKVISCNICHKKFKYAFALQQHILTKHPRDSKSYDQRKKIKTEQTEQSQTSEQLIKRECNFERDEFEGNPKKRAKFSERINIFDTVLPKMKSVEGLDRPFICNFCENGFKTNEELAYHIHIHEKEDPFKCGICGMAFKFMESMQLHVKSHYSSSEKEASTEMDEDDYGVEHYKESGKFGKHLRDHKFEKYIWDRNFEKHVWNHSIEKRVWEHSFEKQVRAYSFGKSAEEDSFTEQVRGKSFKKHVKHLKCEKVVGNSVSEKVVKGYSDERHVSNDLVDEKPMGDCSVEKLKHSLSVEKGMDNCNAEVRLKNQQGEKERSRKSYRCSICTKLFKSKHQLKHHRAKTHKNCSPAKCDICNIELLKSNLKRHVLAVHSNDRPFECKLCGMGFKRKDNLQVHEAKHTK